MGLQGAIGRPYQASSGSDGSADAMTLVAAYGQPKLFVGCPGSSGAGVVAGLSCNSLRRFCVARVGPITGLNGSSPNTVPRFSCERSLFGLGRPVANMWTVLGKNRGRAQSNQCCAERGDHLYPHFTSFLRGYGEWPSTR